jgi:hypothetical protein
LTNTLIDWKSELGHKFVYVPQKGLPKSDLDKLEKEIESIQNSLEQVLFNGPSHLRNVINQIQMKRTVLLREAEDCAQKLAQATADL